MWVWVAGSDRREEIRNGIEQRNLKIENRKRNLTQRTQSALRRKEKKEKRRKKREERKEKRRRARHGRRPLQKRESGFAEVEEFGAESEAFRFVGGVKNSCHQPDDAGPFGPVLQAEQESEAKNKTKTWDEGIDEEVALAGVVRTEGEMQEGDEVDSHEGD